METIEFRRWLKDHSILNRSFEFFWTDFNEHLCRDWANDLRLSSPFKKEDIAIEIFEVNLRLEDFSNIRKTEPCEYVEVDLLVFFKRAAIASFKVHFDLSGKFVSYECGWNMIMKSIRENIFTLEELRNQLENEITVEEYGVDGKNAIISIIDKKLKIMKDSFK